MDQSDQPGFLPPSRHQGSRLVARPPDAVRAVTVLRNTVVQGQRRQRPDTLAFVAADVATGVACTSASFVRAVKTLVTRSGAALYVDVSAGTGAASVVEARLAVPDLGLTGAAVATASGGTEHLIRVTLPLPDAWPMGEAHLVYVEARRVSGADATTVQVVAARQR